MLVEKDGQFSGPETRLQVILPFSFWCVFAFLVAVCFQFEYRYSRQFAGDVLLPND